MPACARPQRLTANRWGCDCPSQPHRIALSPSARAMTAQCFLAVVRRLIAICNSKSAKTLASRRGLPKAMLNKSSRVWAPWFGMGCKAHTTAIAQLWRGFATPQTAQNRDDHAARDLFSVALGRIAGLCVSAWAASLPGARGGPAGRLRKSGAPPIRPAARWWGGQPLVAS